VFFEFFDRGTASLAMCSTFFVLIPKVDGAKEMGKFRPIILVSSLYKIISEVLAGRLKEVMGGVISGIQSAFIQGKAYDCVDWDFLFWVLLKEGFGDRCILWMKGCIMESFFSILINGTSKGFFKAARGLRQGDSLSPFLFSLVADGLSAIIRKAEAANLMEGFVIGDDRVMVSHL